jgi:hypothetical protein
MQKSDDKLGGIEGGKGIEQASDAVNKILDKVNLGLPAGLKLAADSVTQTLKDYDDSIYQLQTKYFGGGREFETNIRAALTSGADGIIRMGGSLSDVKEIQSDISSTLQTNFILQGDTYSEIFAASKLAAGSTEKATLMSEKLIGDFKTLGYSIFEIGDSTGEIINQVKSLGVNANSVFEMINKNVGQLNLYNFSDGINGMAKMAAEAAMLRIDMKTTLDIADRLFNPEKAIDMAAGFQRLGVQVTDLLDPLTLMDISLNDPARLQESIVEMTKSLTYFDEKNQKISILPGEQRRLREIADVMGINAGELSKMAINAGELQEKMKRIELPSFIPEGDEEDVKTLIANLSQLKDGKLMVTIPGQKELVEASDLTQEQLQKLRDQKEEEAKSPVQLQSEANGYLNKIVNEGIVVKGMVQRGLAGSENVASYITEGAKAMEKEIENLKVGIASVSNTFTDLNQKSKESIEKGDYSTAISEFLNQVIKPANEQLYEQLIKGSLESLDKFAELFGVNLKNIDIPELITKLFESKSQSDNNQVTNVTQASDFVKFPDEVVQTLPEDTIFGATTKGKEKFDTIINPITPNTIPPVVTPQINETTNKSEVSGTIELKVVGPPGFETSKLQEYFDNPINMDRIAEALYPKLQGITGRNETAFS